MSTFKKIIEGLAMLDKDYARDKRASDRERESDERRDKSQEARDRRMQDMTLARDKMLAAEQAVRDARLHGNAMDVQKAQIDADRTRYEYQATQESVRQDKDIGARKKENKEQRGFLGSESEKDRSFRSLEAERQRGFIGGESEKDRGHARGMAQEDRTWRTGERKGTEKFQSRENRRDRRNRMKSIDAAAAADVYREDAIAGNRERRTQRKLASVFPDGMNPAERETAVRDMERMMTYDLPMAEARGRMGQIESTKGGVLFPGYFGYRGKTDGQGGGNPFGTAADAGRTGLNLNDIMKEEEKARRGLNSVDENLYD